MVRIQQVLREGNSFQAMHIGHFHQFSSWAYRLLLTFYGHKNGHLAGKELTRL